MRPETKKVEEVKLVILQTGGFYLCTSFYYSYESYRARHHQQPPPLSQVKLDVMTIGPQHMIRIPAVCW